MTLRSIDGTKTFELEILRYQFPEIEHDAWDSNWLVMFGNVISNERSWNFTDPCLLTIEAHELANWLAELASGQPAPKTIDFTEPNLSFKAIGSDARSVVLRVYFAFESRPSKAVAESDDFFEVFRISRDDLAIAARDLCRSLRRYPIRAGARPWVSLCVEE